MRRAKAVHSAIRGKAKDKSKLLDTVMTAKDIHSSVKKKHEKKAEENMDNKYLEKIAKKEDRKPGYGEATKTVAKATGRGALEGIGGMLGAGALGAGAGLLALKTRKGAKFVTGVAKKAYGGKTGSQLKKNLAQGLGAIPAGYAGGLVGSVHGNIASTKKSLEKQYEKGQEKKANIYLEKIAAEKWIQKAIKHPGALHEKLGVPEDKKIPAAKLEAAAHKPGKLGQEARLAKTLKSFHKKAEESAEAKADQKKYMALEKGEIKTDGTKREDCSYPMTTKQAGILSSVLGAAKAFGKGVVADTPKVGEQFKNVRTAYKANKGLMNKGTLSTIKALGKNKAIQAGAGLTGAGLLAGKAMSGQKKEAAENVYLDKVAQMFGGFNLPKPPVPTMAPSTLGSSTLGIRG